MVFSPFPLRLFRKSIDYTSFRARKEAPECFIMLSLYCDEVNRNFSVSFYTFVKKK